MTRECLTAFADLLGRFFEHHDVSPKGIEGTLSKDVLADLVALKVDSLYFLQYQPDSPRQRLYSKVWDLQMEALHELLRAFKPKDMPPLVWKGVDCVPRYCKSQPLGLMNDIDLLVPEDDLQRLKALLYTMGYSSAIFDSEKHRLCDRTPREIAAIESYHYELAPMCKAVQLELDRDEMEVAETILHHPVWCRNGECTVIIEFDVHSELVLDVPAQPLFTRSRAGSIPGIRSLDATDALWLMTSRFYTEVSLHEKRSARDWIYIAGLLKYDDIDWERVIEVADEMQLRPALYYYLAFLNSIIHSLVPETVLEELSPQRGRRHRDWGWQIGPVFGLIEEMPFMLSEKGITS